MMIYKNLFLVMFAVFLIAIPPVLAQEGGITAADLNGLYSDSDGFSKTPLDQPHRTPKQIEQWLTEKVSALLSFQIGAYEDHIQKADGFMNESGLAEYSAYMEQSNILDFMRSNAVKVQSYVELAPSKRNEGVIEGRFRWLYQIPVTLTFLPEGVNDYGNQDPINERVMVTVQLGRTKNADYDDLIIESWKARENK